MRPGRSREQQHSLWLNSDQIPRTQGHVLYEWLQKLLHQGGFDAFLEKLCAPFYAEKPGRRSIPPGRPFRMLLIGGKNLKASAPSAASAGVARRSLALLREFLALVSGKPVPDHSSWCRIRQRLPLEVHHEVVVYVLGSLEKARLLLAGKYPGIHAAGMGARMRP